MNVRTKRVLRRGALLLLGVVVVVVGVTWQLVVRHSGSLDEYERFLVNDTGSPTPGSVKVTAMGTTMMLIDDGTTQVLIDPFITEVSLWQAAFNGAISTDRAAVDAALDRVGATRIDAVFVSHSHFDHALDLAYVAERTGASVYGSESSLNIARGGGVPENQLNLLSEAKEVQVGDFSVRTLASRHSPISYGGGSPTIDEPLSQADAGWRDYKEGGTFDFLVSGSGPTMMFKGSANWVPGAYDGLDVDALFMGLAGIGKADKSFADGYLEATVDALEPGVVVPTHWNDFFSTVEPHPPLHRKLIDDSPEAFDRFLTAADQAGSRVALLDVFSSIVIERR